MGLPATSLEGVRRERPPVSRSNVWLRRLDLFLRVVVRLNLGLLLIALPWLPFWGENHFFALYPRLGDLAESGAFRGLVSGLGLLNVWIAISDAVHYRDPESDQGA